jgi:predicted Mrr-cat superfamily restriction endonuclease
MNNTYVLRGENGSFVPYFKKGGFASMGWFSQDETFELEKSDNRDYIKEVLIRSNPTANNYTIGQWAGMVYRFINATKIGDKEKC